MTELEARTKILLENIRDHLRDPKGRSDIEESWLNEIDAILGVECEVCGFGGWYLALPEEDQEFAIITTCSCHAGQNITQRHAEVRAHAQIRMMKKLFIHLIDSFPQYDTGDDINGADAVDWLMRFIQEVKTMMGAE